MGDTPRLCPVAGPGDEARYLRLLAWITDYIYTVAVEAGRPVKTTHSPACRTVTGYSMAEYEANPSLWLEMIHPADRPVVMAQAATALAGRTPAPVEHRIVRKDGSIRWLRNTIVLEQEADGRVIGYDGVITDVTERKRLEQGLQEASDREQCRIGQELHDGLAQSLIAVGYLANVLEEELELRAAPETRRANELVELIDQAISQARQFARGLYPARLDSGDLESALHDLAGHLGDLYNVRIQLQATQPARITDRVVASNLYRIAQQAVVNSIRHGQAKQIDLRLTTAPESVVLAVADNGIGLPEPLPATPGLGIHIMRYRAQSIGGVFEIQRPPQGGTLVTCRVRLAQ